MVPILEKARRLVESGAVALPKKLVTLLEHGFQKEAGCLVFRWMWEHSPATVGSFQDRTAFEMFVNHVHMEDFARTRSVAKLLARALVFSEELLSRVRTMRLNKPYRVIISVQTGGCVVHHHQMRTGEDSIPADLEAYKEEAVLVMDVPARA